MSSTYNHDVIMSYISGYVAGGAIRVTRDPLNHQINQVVMTKNAAEMLNNFGAVCVESSEAKHHHELGDCTYVTSLGAIAGLAPEAAGAVEHAQEVRIKPVTSNKQLG